MEAGTKEWLAYRRSHIGGSDISAINGTNKYKTKYTLWLEKTGRKEEDKPNYAMEHGLMLEPVARSVYMCDHGLTVMPHIVVFDEWDKAMASLDGITQDGKIIQEFKCPISENLYDNALFKAIPDMYFDQCQWNLMCSGAQRCDYMVFIDEFKYAIVQVYPDKIYQEELLEKAKEFWKYIENDTPPEMENDEFEYKEVDQTDFEKLMKWKELKLQEKQIVKEKKIIEDELKMKFKNKTIFYKEKVKLNWITNPGSIDWKQIQTVWQISDNDIEVYRKKPSTYGKFSIVD